MAEVYLARREGPRGFHKQVAVKRVLPQLARDAEFVQMFEDEARVSALLSHPNVVQVFDFGEADGELYLAMEFVDGTTCARLIREAAATGSDIPLEVSLHVTLSILRGLAYAHGARDERGKSLHLVHRDVSPGNVLIDRSGAVKLGDFGIARAADFERRTDVGQLKGKLGYMSPEQVMGKELDARSDLFTTAIVLAELVTARPLFSGGRELDVLLRIRDVDLAAIDRNASRVPDDVRAVLYRALSREPSLRYPSAGAFAEALEEIIRRRRLDVGPARTARYIERLGLIERVDEGDNSGSGGHAGSETALVEIDGPNAPLAVDAEQPTSPQALEAGQPPRAYRVRLPSGAIAGPMSYPRLIEMFATGGADGGTPIARDGGAFQSARALPELTRFVTSPALQWDDEAAGQTTLRAPLARTTLPRLVFKLSFERETGVLVIRDGARRKKVYFVEGAPEFVASTDKRELLGEHLVAQGQVLRMEVDMALAMLPRFGGRIGDALVGLGVLRPVELFRAIHLQTQARLVELFSWRRGELTFVRGARSHEETFPVGIDACEVIARGVRAGYTFEEIDRILEPLSEALLVPSVSPPVRPEHFRLTDREARVLRQIDGTYTLQRLYGAGIADPDEVARAVFIALSGQLVSAPRWGLD